MPNTAKHHRILRANPEKIYQAFLQPEALAKWLPPYGFTCLVHHLQPQVNGSFKMSFRNFSTGTSDSFGGTYLELQPFERIKYSNTFDNPHLPGEIHTTIELRPVRCGTESISCKKEFPLPFRWKCVTSAGRNLCNNWPILLNPIFPASPSKTLTPHP